MPGNDSLLKRERKILRKREKKYENDFVKAVVGVLEEDVHG